MTEKLRFTRAQIRCVASIARTEGVGVKLNPDGSIVVFPDVHKPETVDESDDKDLDRELAAFEAKHDYN